jgi:DNA-directed RNA polymerase subunit RPC12/RpoP
MTDGMTYKCSVCGREVTVEKGGSVPFCCKKEMEPLPFCTEQPQSEMARNYDEDLPCNDGTLHHPPPGPDTGVDPGEDPGSKT